MRLCDFSSGRGNGEKYMIAIVIINDIRNMQTISLGSMWQNWTGKAFSQGTKQQVKGSRDDE